MSKAYKCDACQQFFDGDAFREMCTISPNHLAEIEIKVCKKCYMVILLFLDGFICNSVILQNIMLLERKIK
jgi:rubredoxin